MRANETKPVHGKIEVADVQRDRTDPVKELGVAKRLTQEVAASEKDSAKQETDRKEYHLDYCMNFVW